MEILLIGQTSLQWGRMEFGNIGNYYIIEPLIRELHRVFPDAIIKTTLQMSDDFCIKEKIVRLPLELYYSWEDNRYLNKSIYELGIAEIFSKTGIIVEKTPYIKAVIEADLVVDFSGDIWSDNADFVGENRFLIGLIKDRIPQLFGKKTVMLSGSPSPFKNHNNAFTKEVFEGFDLVTNREEISYSLLKQYGFNLTKVKNFACPAFLFEPAEISAIKNYISKYKLDKKDIVKTGFIICGWNLIKGPFDRTNILDSELLIYVEAIEEFINKKNTVIYLMSHSNGFDLFPNFKLKHGRDFPLVSQIYDILNRRGNINLAKVFLITEVLTPSETKAIIGQFDMLISGRIHGAVAGLSQNIPTVIIDYGHEPKAHKLKGFAQIVGLEELVATPNSKEDLLKKINFCYNNRLKIKKKLEIKMNEVRGKIKKSFNILKTI